MNKKYTLAVTKDNEETFFQFDMKYQVEYLKYVTEQSGHTAVIITNY